MWPLVGSEEDESDGDGDKVPKMARPLAIAPREKITRESDPPPCTCICREREREIQQLTRITVFDLIH